MPYEERRTRARRGTVLLALLLGLAATVIPAGPASAHAYLENTDPAQDARLSAAPERVDLVFGEDIQTEFTKVTLAIGSSAPATVATDIADRTVTVQVPAVIANRQAPGSTESWKVTYRTVAGDGHPVEGTLTFSVTASSAGASTRPGSAASAGAGAPSASGTSMQGPSAPSPAAGVARPDAADPFPWPTVGLLSAVTLGLAGVLWLLARRAQRSGQR